MTKHPKTQQSNEELAGWEDHRIMQISVMINPEHQTAGCAVRDVLGQSCAEFGQPEPPIWTEICSGRLGCETNATTSKLRKHGWVAGVHRSDESKHWALTGEVLLSMHDCSCISVMVRLTRRPVFNNEVITTYWWATDGTSSTDHGALSSPLTWFVVHFVTYGALTIIYNNINNNNNKISIEECPPDSGQNEVGV